MKKTQMISVHIDLKNPKTLPIGYVDKEALNQVTERQILEQEKEDDLELMNLWINSSSHKRG
jgi:hypothetical protein